MLNLGFFYDNFAAFTFNRKEFSEKTCFRGSGSMGLGSYTISKNNDISDEAIILEDC